ncbi:MAG: winged helix-turn-helix domain-containing protein [Marinicellaceae bacterium]
MNYYFSGFTYDTQQQKLWFNDELVKLTKKNNKLLYYLLQNSQKLVNKEELITNIWDGRVVTGNTIDQTIMKLRKALNNTNPGKYIEAVYGQGLRFIPTVTNEKSLPSQKPSFTKPAIIATTILAFLSILLFLYFNKKPQQKLSKIDVDLSSNQTIGMNQNNWLIYGSGRYLTYLLTRYNGLHVDGFSFDNNPENSYNVLALNITTHNAQKINLLVDFKDSTEDDFVVKLIDNNSDTINSTQFSSDKIHGLFEDISQWIISNYTDDLTVNNNSESVFTDDEYALESYFRGIEAQKTGNSSLATTFLKTATQQDPEFKYAWYELAIAYRKQGDPKKALSVLNAIKTNNQLLQYHVTLVKAQCLDITQDFKIAEIIYQQAYQSAINLNQEKKIAAVLVSQAIMNRKLKNYEQSETYLNNALELIGPETNPYLYGTIINTYAKLERDQHNYESAIEKSLLAIDAFNKSGDLRYVAQSKTALSSILLLRNDFDAAKNLISESLFYAQEVNNQRGISDNKTKLAMIYQKTGRFDLAIQNWNDVLELTQELGLYGNKAQAHFWLVKLYLHANKKINADSHVKKIKQLFSEEPKSSINNYFIEAQLLMSFVDNDYVLSKDLLSQLEQLKSENVSLYRGDLAHLQDKFGAAEIHYLDFLLQKEKSRNYDMITTALNRLSVLYIRMKSDKLLNNINRTESYNPPIYPFNIYKAETAFLLGNKIEAISLLEEVKLKSKDLWQQKDQFILEQLSQ